MYTPLVGHWILFDVVRTPEEEIEFFFLTFLKYSDHNSDYSE